MADQYSRSLLKVAIAQICQGLGWHAMQSTPCDIMVDILQRYIEKTGRVSSQYAAQFGRTHVNLDDLALAFQDTGVNLYEMENYIHEVEPVPFAHDVPSFPIPKKNNLQHPPPGSRHCRERLASIPEYMPPLVGVKEDFTPLHDRRDSLFSCLSMDADNPELTSPSGQDSLDKRGEKRSPDYVDYSIKRFRLDSEGNLQEVIIGEDSNKRRVGKLPEAVTPPRRSSVLMGITQDPPGIGPPKPKSPKQQKYGTQETKAPKMRLPSSASKSSMKPLSKSPKHHLFSPKGPSKYSVKSKNPANVGVVPQPNKPVVFKPSKGTKAPRAHGAISALLSAAMQIQDDENLTPVVPIKKKNSAMSIYDFDDDIEGKGKENVVSKDATSDVMKSPITSGESRVDPNSPRVYDEYEIIRTTLPVANDDKTEVKKKVKGKVRKKKEKVKEKVKKKKTKGLDKNLFVVKKESDDSEKESPVKIKDEVFSDSETKLTPSPSSIPAPSKKLKPPKLDLSKLIKEETVEEPVVTTPKIVIKKFVMDDQAKKKVIKSPVTLKKTKKLEKWRKKKFKKDKYKFNLGFSLEQGVKTISKVGSPSKSRKEKPLKKLNIIKTSSTNPFQIKISSPKVEDLEEPIPKEKPRKKKKIKEEKKASKDELSSSKASSKMEEKKPIKSEPPSSSNTTIPKITLKMGSNTGEGKFVIKTIHPPSSPVEMSSPPSSPISTPPVPKISIPVLPPKKPAPKTSTPKVTKAPSKKTMKVVKESSVFDESLPPPTKPRLKGKGPSKTTKTDSPISPKGPAKGKKGLESGNKKPGPKSVKNSPPASKATSANKPASTPGGKASVTTSNKSSKSSGATEVKKAPGRPKSVKTVDPPKAEVREQPSKKMVEKPPKKEKPPPPDSPPSSPGTSDDGPMTIVTETIGTSLSDTGEKIWICPACKRPDDGSPMVGCDDCDDWYHWPCVGIACEPSEDEWFCDRCLAIRNKSKGKKKGRKKKL